MKAKILAELNKKYLGLSKKVLGLIADKLAQKVTEETEIEGAIAELENSPISLQDYADFLQRDGDERVTVAKKQWEKANPPGANPPADTPPSDDPTTAKLTEMYNKLAQMEARENTARLRGQLEKSLNEKKIPLKFIGGRTPQTEEQLVANLAEIEADWNEVKTELANQGFSSTPQPFNGNTGDISKCAMESDIKGWAAANNAQPGK